MIALWLEPAAAASWPASDPGPGLRGLLVATAVVALVGVLAWLLRRGTLRAGGRRTRAAMSIESGVSLGERRSLAIVTVEGRRLLLALTPVQVSLLMELPAAGRGFERALDQSIGAPPETLS